MEQTKVSAPAPWSDEELAQAIDAYLSMLKKELNGIPFNKSEVNQHLREHALPQRSKQSIEQRMQNISALMLQLGRPRIKGYVPLQNIGRHVRERMVSLLRKADLSFLNAFVATEDGALLEQRTHRLRTLPALNVPIGATEVATARVTTTVFVRDPHVRAWVLRQSRGRCEGCGQPAPFSDSHGLPYLEVHHVRPLAQGGSDRISNTVALCPNCHRRCHLAEDKDAFTATLYTRVERLVIECDPADAVMDHFITIAPTAPD